MADAIIDLNKVGEALNEKMDLDLNNSTVLKAENGIVSVINAPDPSATGNEICPMSLRGSDDNLKADGSNATAKTNINIARSAIGLPSKLSSTDELYGVDIDIVQIGTQPYWGVTYVPGCDNMYYAPAKMDFDNDVFRWGDWEQAFFVKGCKPCALKYDGTVDYFLNKNDYTLKEDGSASDVTSSAYGGNFMVQFPKVFTKVRQIGSKIRILISNNKLDNEFECFPCKKADGTYADYWYRSIYQATNVDSKLRSFSSGAKPTASLTSANEFTYARANGEGWNTACLSSEEILKNLFVLMFKSVNSQEALGFGATTSTSGLTVNLGVCDKKGLCYGTKAASALGMKFLGIEQYYGHTWNRIQGLLLVNGRYKIKMTQGTQDGSTATDYNDTGDGYIDTGINAPAASQSYITAMNVHNTSNIMLPVAVGGSASTYYSDGMWSNLTITSKALLGCCVAHGAFVGVFALTVSDLPSFALWVFGSSLSYHL